MHLASTQTKPGWQAGRQADTGAAVAGPSAAADGVALRSRKENAANANVADKAVPPQLKVSAANAPPYGPLAETSTLAELVLVRFEPLPEMSK